MSRETTGRHAESERRVGVAAIFFGFLFLGFVAPLRSQESTDNLLEWARRKASQAEVEDQRLRTEMQQELQQRREELAKRRAARDWALGSFEATERRVLDTPASLPGRMERWERNRVLWTRVYTGHPEQCAGAIKSGKALNFLLDKLGSSTLDQELRRSHLEAEIDQAKRELAALDDMEQIRAKRQEIQELELRQRFLGEIILRGGLTERQLGLLCFEKGLLGNKLTVRNIEDSALPLDWPSMVRDDYDFTPFREVMEQSKARALQELREGRGISPETSASLRRGADAIERLVRSKRMEYIESVETYGTSDPVAYNRLLEARNFAHGLRQGVYRFIEARETVDVQTMPFRGKSIQELFAYMARNGLRFAPAEINAEDAYRAIYQYAVLYYMDLNYLTMASEREEIEAAENEALAAEMAAREERELEGKYVELSTELFRFLGNVADAQRAQEE